MTEIVIKEEDKMSMDVDASSVTTPNEHDDTHVVCHSPTKPNVTTSTGSTPVTTTGGCGGGGGGGNGSAAYTAVTPYNTTSTVTKSTSNVVTGTTGTISNEVVTPQLLSLYYQHLFPYDFIYDWFRYGTTSSSSGGGGGGGGGGAISSNNNDMNLFLHREFSFTIKSIQDDEIYLRYQSYSNVTDFKAAIQKRIPMKIDIGAIFSHPPVHKHTTNATAFQPIERELVFDIDLTDYDDVRNCGCQNANICRICWKYMSMAMHTITTSLRDDFQFQHIQWFYSGRRGIHCWVCDDTAKSLTDQGRTAIANYLTVNLGTDKNQDVHLSFPLHPFIHRAYEILEPYFIRDVIVSKKHGGHGLLYSEDQYMNVLNSLPDCAAAVRERLHENWLTKKSTPVERWNELKQHIAFHKEKGDLSCGKKTTAAGGNNERPKKTFKTSNYIDFDEERKRNQLEIFCVEVVLKYTYPRIDINVSKMRNHLLKSPFCIHPKTGRVCVPISKTEYNTFNPFTVPTISQIIQEYYDAVSKSSGKDSTQQQEHDDTSTTTTNNSTTTTENEENDDTAMSTNQLTKQSTTTTKKSNQRNTKNITATTNNKWECTSLYPYYMKFQNEFLLPLQKESRQSMTDRKDAMNLDF